MITGRVLLHYTAYIGSDSIVSWRFAAYASVQVNRDLGFSDSVYGFAASMFFVSYAIFQVHTHMLWRS